MRYSVPAKFFAILIAAVTLACSFVCALGIVQAETYGLYTRDFNEWARQQLDREVYDLAEGLAERYACMNESNCTTETLRQIGYRRVVQDVLSWSGFSAEEFGYQILDKDGTMLDGLAVEGDQILTFEVVCSAEFPRLITKEAPADAVYGKDYIRSEEITLNERDKMVTIRYYDSPKYTVVVMLRQDAALNRYGSSVPLVELLYNQRYNMMWILLLTLCLSAAGIVYLCCAAGKRYEQDLPRLSGLNRIPLDLYGLLAAVAGVLCGSVIAEKVKSWLRSGADFNFGNLVIVAMLLAVISLLVIGVVYALVAQLKMKQRYWWQHTLLSRLIKGLGAITSRLPVIWNYLTVGFIMGSVLALSVYWAREKLWWPLLVVAVIYMAIVCYGAYAYAQLFKGAQRMAQGDLEDKISTRYLTGSYAKCADSLNQLSDVAVVAAREQMRSERMRTELITNVSHDIKTPLTSIINYVDLLKTASSEDQTDQYLEVLGRQSQRMKKLIEDLMELSKASSGTMAVDLRTLDLTETLNQALGEFYDKLNAAQLNLLYEPPAQAVTVWGDGRLTWRVLSNLLSNAVKYAMPGTRVYLELRGEESFAEVSLKNISAEPLNVSAQDLTERFVRGDASRNTEGSGLGLNIAKNLMELQNGSLQLTVDGDLFKATLRFSKQPSAEEA